MGCVIYCREHCPNGIILQRFVAVVNYVSRYRQNIRCVAFPAANSPSIRHFNWYYVELSEDPIVTRIPLLFLRSVLACIPTHACSNKINNLSGVSSPRRTLLFCQFFYDSLFEKYGGPEGKTEGSIAVTVTPSSWSHCYHNPTAVMISMHFLQRQLKVNLLLCLFTCAAPENEDRRRGEV